jgi:hypothetical protein
MLSTTVREKSVGKMISMRLLAILLLTAVAVFFTMGETALAKKKKKKFGTEELEAKIIFETNFTDKDTGIQIFTDGDPWRKVRVFDPDGKLMFDIKGKGSLKNFGLTELFSESNEPNWEEDESLSDIVDRFPEGEYLFEARTVEREWLKGVATLSHELPCAPDEDSLSPSEETVSAAAAVVIDWDPVTNMLDNDAETCSEDSEDSIDVEKYQVIVENLDNENEFSIFLEASDTEVTLPEEFVENNTNYKYEVLAIADNGNQTIAETWFCTGTPPGPGEEDLCEEPED